MSFHRMSLLIIVFACACNHEAGENKSHDSGVTDASVGPGPGADLAGDDGGKSDGGKNDQDGGSDTDGGSVSCGGTTCYVGQTCVAGACAFTSCDGVKVPGDYATIQAAVSAFMANTGTGTICLGAQTYDETVAISGATVAITIQGLSASQTSVAQLSLSFGASVIVRGARIGEVYFGDAASASLSYASLGSFITNGGGSLSLDGVDVSPGAGATAITTTQGTGETFTLSVQNSYLHDAENGIAMTTGEDPGNTTLTLINNTFAHISGTAVSTPAGCVDTEVCPDPAVTYFNDLFVDNGVAVNLGINNTTSFGDNAFFGNTTNYAGTAVPGTGYVTTDPLLDTATPPGLLAGSPCRGAADPTHAPALDFWGHSRGVTPDIGAVQSSP
jgi:hypothetical protein